jgi:hypothetical protein
MRTKLLIKQVSQWQITNFNIDRPEVESGLKYPKENFTKEFYMKPMV